MKFAMKKSGKKFEICGQRPRFVHLYGTKTKVMNASNRKSKTQYLRSAVIRGYPRLFVPIRGLKFSSAPFTNYELPITTSTST